MTEPNSLPVWQVDAFADRPFQGNPAAICLLDQYPDDVWLQNVAREMNLSETAFLVPSDVTGRFDLRWFTPALEVDLCGHATLASAHLLYELGKVDPSQSVEFSTRSGLLKCHRDAQRVAMDFPATPICDSVDESTQAELREIIGHASFIAKSKYDILMVFDSAAAIANLDPNFDRLRNVATRGLIATAASTESGIDFVSRFFAPQSGINEDPVTGSAHCCLAPYWSDRLDKESLVGRQGSVRQGSVYTQWLGERVRLSGNAVTVMSGQLAPITRV